MKTLPIPHPGQLLLLAAPRAFLSQAMPLLIARLSLPNGIWVLDFGNSFNYHVVARTLRRHTIDLPTHLERIRIARAFTCYQVLSLLAQTPTSIHPTIGLEFLSTFHDENVSGAERWRLFDQSLEHLRRLSQLAPVAVSAAIPPTGGTDAWFTALEEHASQVWRLENHQQAFQPRFF
ncbi:MAG TPA: hypothetical protein VLH85_03005 [Levilinea sp.]|nr:hypothetical protein [Levilinea sp.]